MLIQRAEVDGRVIDLRIQGGRVREMGSRLSVRSGERVLDARAWALVPGLHDHHIHLLALAAASVLSVVLAVNLRKKYLTKDILPMVSKMFLNHAYVASKVVDVWSLLPPSLVSFLDSYRGASGASLAFEVFRQRPGTKKYGGCPGDAASQQDDHKEF